MKFSIITPTYNRASSIKRAIQSILNQSYQNFEMIIIDDGSTDNTLDVLKKISHDPRIKVFKSKNNGGVNVARNIGLKNISKDVDWVTFLDSDDEFFFDALEKIKLSIENNILINYFRFPVQYTDGSIQNSSYLFNTYGDYEKYLKNIDNYGDWVTVINRKVILDGFVFCEEVNAFELIAWLSLSKKENVYYDKSAVLLCHIDNDSISRPKEKPLSYYINAIQGYSIILNEFGDDLLKNNKKVYISYLFLVSYLNILVGNNILGLKQTLKAMKYDFFNIRTLRNFISFTYPKYK
jgi:glycosyltransferase involved in cell wall biosynthesis